MSFPSFNVGLPDGYFYTDHPKPTGWFHIVLNYIGPNDGEGLRILIDGTEVGSATNKDGGAYPAGDGRIVVGREYTDSGRRYASVRVDELIYFNASLTSDNVQSIYDSA